MKSQDGGFKITKSEIACEAKVRGLNQADVAKHAETGGTAEQLEPRIAAATVTVLGDAVVRPAEI